MNELFWGWLSLSLSGSILICVTFLLNRLFQKKISRQYQYYLWLIVIARLLIPFTPEASLMGRLFQNVDSIRSSAPKTDEAYANRVDTDRVMRSDTVDEMYMEEYHQDLMDDPVRATGPGTSGEQWAERGFPDATGSFGGSADSEIATGQYGQVYEYMIAGAVLLWLMAAFGLLTHKIWLYRIFHRHLRQNGREVTDLALLEALGNQMERMGIRREVGLYTNSCVASPLLTGLFHPFIVLPDMRISEDEFNCTILHELTHEKRMDFLYKWLTVTTVCLHWFNPLVWLMAREISRACELSCDEAVIRRLDGPGKKTYGDTLLHAAALKGTLRDPASSVALYEGKKLLKERLELIMTFRKSSKAAHCGALLLSLLLFTGAFFSGAYFTPASADILHETEKTDNNRSVYYTQSSYYTGSHIVEIGYNLPPSFETAYPVKKDIALSDGSTYPVRFSEDAKSYAFSADERGVLAVRQALSDLKADTAGNGHEITAPFVVSLKEVPAGKTVKELGDLYYQDDKMTDFTAVFAALNDTDKKTFTDAIYRDERIAYFASVSGHLSDDSIMDIALRSIDDKNTSFFHVAIGELDNTHLKQLAGLLAKNEDSVFYNFLVQLLEEEALTAQSSAVPKKTYPLINEQSFKISGITAIHAEYILDPVFLYDSPTDELLLKEYFSPDDKSYIATASLKDGKLKILTGNRPDPMPVNYKSRIELYIPKEYAGSILIETTSGNIASDLTNASSFSAVSTSGDIRVSAADGDLKCSTTSGTIKVTGHNGPTFCDTTSGDIYIQDTDGSLLCDSVSGNIEVTGSALNGSFTSTSGSLRLEGSRLTGDLNGHTTSGSITVSLPSDASFQADAVSYTGDLTSQFKEGLFYSDRSPSGLSDRKLTCRQGSEPYYRISLKSGSGNVRLEKNDK